MRLCSELPPSVVRGRGRVQLVGAPMIDGRPIGAALRMERRALTKGWGKVSTVNSLNGQTTSVGVLFDGASKGLVLDASCLAVTPLLPDMTDREAVERWLTT